MVLCSVLSRHRERSLQTTHQVVRVPWIHLDASLEALSGTCEFGQDQLAMSLLLTHDVFVRNQIHTVPGRGDETDVGHRVQRQQLRKRHRVVDKFDRSVVNSAESSVDLADQFTDHCSQVLVFLDVLATRHGDLNEDHFAHPLGIVLQKHFKGVKLLRDTFDVIQTVHTDDDSFVVVSTLERFLSFLHLFVLQAVDYLFRVNTDREGAYVDVSVLVCHAVRCRREADNSCTRAQKVSRVVVGVEADQITM